MERLHENKKNHNYRILKVGYQENDAPGSVPIVIVLFKFGVVNRIRLMHDLINLFEDIFCIRF